ncbi:PREDICTED: odorant receptor 65a [Wasmannia auropunctata]|uniref:odorant receptor 65a n=1 Tax=Wasmannia auropunctata TaxID=64793 RepID=UPI0005F0565D|nr:PREDICTED: odorant receptor 65a [Wasmannia auropunctata]
MCCIPAFGSTKFPIEGTYPFLTESPFVIFIIYITQIYFIVQCGFCIGVDLLFAIFFLYSAAKLEMLCLEIQTVRNEGHINSCIKKHQEIIKFVDDTRDVVQFILFKTNITMAICSICSIFPIIHESLERSFQFIFIVIAGCQRLYITACPADDLMENSERVATEAYNILWSRKSRCIIIKNICFIIQRSQKPLVISMGSLLPTLSLKYYAKYLMKLLSYFMTIRAIIYNLNH